MLGRLGAQAWDDLEWLTESELYTYFDEAAKQLARSGVFVDEDSTVTLSAGESQYTTPAGWISSVRVSGAQGVLRPASTFELEALDSAWETAQGPPYRYSMDAGPLGTVTLYPQPTANQQHETLTHVYHRFPPDVSTAQTAVPVPEPVADYFAYFALQRARGKESEGAMPEMAAHFAERVQMYEQILASYWGEQE